ncbi:anti-sigma factor family protein [Massilia litorea]|uniref:Anti-sigma factor n=1 Tax=Massilia litorea TaxID=2769491 RepID=A0A7L9U416_9BURK|nr:anti-sigma factor [Massilia litorea]QOL49748.1 anti-sigma factor [Massilia litorea]
MNGLPMTEADLQAYVDGLLPPARQAEVEAWLLTRPDEAERLAAYREQNRELRRLFDPVLDEPIPAALRAPAPRRAWWSGPAGRCAAALAIAFAGGLAGWTLRAAADAHGAVSVSADAGPAANSLPRQAAIAHVVYSPELRHPVEVGADQEQHLVAWLSKRLGAPVRPPHLGKLGYELIGGRLLPGESGPVAQFMYHNLAGQRLTLYVSTGQTHNRDTGFRFAQEGPVGVFYWIDGKFGYALSAGVTKNELGTIAMAVHEQLDGPQ